MSRLLLLLLTSSATLLVFGMWVPLKAVVAQELLEMAWAESQARQMDTRPWPWADTWPVARMTVPKLGDSMIVLDGTSGESLAFGPGRLTGNDNGRGPVIIAGHRDTHFHQLRYLIPGTEVRLQSRNGQWRNFTVTSARVVDSRLEQIDTQRLADNELLLITCYPFDSLNPGGPLRYVVEARSGMTKARHTMVQIDAVTET
jgi:sortase A